MQKKYILDHETTCWCEYGRRCEEFEKGHQERQVGGQLPGGGGQRDGGVVL